MKKNKKTGIHADIQITTKSQPWQSAVLLW